MSNASFSSVSISQLHAVCGGQQPPAPPPSLIQGAGQFMKKAVPVLKVADAAHAGYTGYERARAAGDNVADSLGTGALDAGNRFTFGALNWLTGRK